LYVSKRVREAGKNTHLHDILSEYLRKNRCRASKSYSKEGDCVSVLWIEFKEILNPSFSIFSISL
jgi:hypothetical protein